MRLNAYSPQELELSAHGAATDADRKHLKRVGYRELSGAQMSHGFQRAPPCGALQTLIPMGGWCASLRVMRTVI